MHTKILLNFWGISKDFWMVRSLGFTARDLGGGASPLYLHATPGRPQVSPQHMVLQMHHGVWASGFPLIDQTLVTVWYKTRGIPTYHYPANRGETVSSDDSELCRWYRVGVPLVYMICCVNFEHWLLTFGVWYSGVARRT